MSARTDLLALVVAPGELGEAIGAEVREGLDGIAAVAVVPDADGALAAIEGRGGVEVPLLVLAAEVGPIDATIARLDTSPELERASTLLVTARPRHDDVRDTIDRDRLDAVIAIPWTSRTLAHHARSQAARWLRQHRPDDPRAAAAAAEDARIDLPDSELLRDLELDATEVTTRLLDGVERVLGPRPRLVLPAGTRLTHQDTGVDAVLIVLSGAVALDRSTPVGDLRLHHGSTGPVIGLLSLAQQRRAFFTARATTEVEVVHLSLEQLDRALREQPEVAAAMAAVSIRALARRLRRAEQLQVEKIELNRALDEERQRLSDALHQLEQARLDLVEQARFATLGELSAGIAHELNNPVAALDRAASHVLDDLDRVLGTHPRGDLLRRTVHDARTRTPRGTAEERRIRRELEAELGDADLARRLVASGIDDPTAARGIEAQPGTLELVEAAAGIGNAVRNLQVAARRITGLVASLRAYARPDAEPVEGVDLHAGIEDTIRLTAHRLRDVQIVRRYGTLPPIRCHPAQLDQLWTILLVNAAEALDGRGRIEIVTDVPRHGQVRVQVIDDGPGIDPQVLPRVFEPRFTTKQGTVRYGLGLGLAIAKRIVDGHGGTITLGSEPGRTVASVVLPVDGPPDDQETRT